MPCARSPKQTTTNIPELLSKASGSYTDSSLDVAFEWSHPGGAKLTAVDMLVTNMDTSNDFSGYGRVIRRGYATGGFADSDGAPGSGRVRHHPGAAHRAAVSR